MVVQHSPSLLRILRLFTLYLMQCFCIFFCLYSRRHHSLLQSAFTFLRHIFCDYTIHIVNFSSCLMLMFPFKPHAFACLCCWRPCILAHTLWLVLSSRFSRELSISAGIPSQPIYFRFLRNHYSILWFCDLVTLSNTEVTLHISWKLMVCLVDTNKQIICMMLNKLHSAKKPASICKFK